MGQKLIVSPCNKYTKLYLHIAVPGVVQRELAAAVVPLVAIEGKPSTYLEVHMPANLGTPTRKFSKLIT